MPTLILLSVFCIVTIVFICRYKKISQELNDLKSKISKYYVKNDFILQNAVLKAYETANAERHIFEARQYKRLLDTLKGRN